MNKEPNDKIHAFCTVDPSHLEKVGDQIFCRKCSREMANLDEPQASMTKSGVGARQMLCGVISAAALSACNTTKEEPEPYEGIYYGRIAPADEILVGRRAAPANGPEHYPRAKPIEGQPGKVESPYGGHEIDISRIPPGSLVIDPKFGAASDKFFRI